MWFSSCDVFWGPFRCSRSLGGLSSCECEAEAFLADLTYVPEEGFTGTDWLQVFVQGGRLQAASQVASSAELGMAVSVEQVEKVVPPAAVLMPERFSIFEDSAPHTQRGRERERQKGTAGER